VRLSSPQLDGNELAYVRKCLESTAISGSGEFVDAFEAGFARWCGARHAVACTNGTAALHLALMGLGVGPGDEVIVPTLTYVATANAVTYCGARPVFVDSEPRTWNVDPDRIEEAISGRTRAIVPVHLYGLAADMQAIGRIAARRGLAVIEDACQAHGAIYQGRRAGSLGDAAVFSFFGSKTLATGEGGAVTTDDADLARRIRKLSRQGMDPDRYYWCDQVGYNYRMPNVIAAIGLAQVENAQLLVERRRQVAEWYARRLRDVPGIHGQQVPPDRVHGNWAVSILLDPAVDRDAAARHLAGRGVETRPLFWPVHALPPYAGTSGDRRFPVAERVARCGITLPAWGGLSRDDVDYVCDVLVEYLASVAGAQDTPAMP